MIRIQRLRAGILDIPDLVLSDGLTAVTGGNGAGKTTFLRLCSGISLPDAGTIEIDGVLPRSCEAGYVSEFPDRHLIFTLVHQEISSSLRFAHKNPDEIDAAVTAAAEQFGLTWLLNRECRTLSGGEKMLVGIAAAVIGKPRLLVLDEPDSHLDPETVAEILSLVRDAGCPNVLWSTHAAAVQNAADRVVLLSQGKVILS